MVIVTDLIWKLKKGDVRKGFYMDPKLKKNLDFIFKKVMDEKYMASICIDGRPGSGKSTLYSQIAYYLNYLNNKKLTLDQLSFNIPQFKEMVQKATPGNCCCLDEAIDASSRTAMSQRNILLVKLMAQVRSKRLFLFFNLPSIFDLDRNIALHRIDLLIHCPSESFEKRGRFVAYFGKNIKSLYLNGKKTYSYSSRFNFRGTFTQRFCLNEKEYEERKQTAVNSIDNITKPRETQKIGRDNLIKHLRESQKLTYKQIAEIVGNISSEEVGCVCRGER